MNILFLQQNINILRFLLSTLFTALLRALPVTRLLLRQATIAINFCIFGYFHTLTCPKKLVYFYCRNSIYKKSCG
ncbi:hypothetical protein EBQ81_04970 [bacterium]|nr:hypothetical protein [bacterium]